MRYKKEPQYYYVRRMLGLGMCVSRGTAAVLNLSCCMLVLPMCRALITTLSGCTSSRTARPRPPSLPAVLAAPATHAAKSTHIMIAVTIVITSVAHTGAHLANAINFSRHYSAQYPEINVANFRGEAPFRLFVATVPGITGVVMVLVLGALCLTSMRWVRRRSYDVFFYTHRLGFVFLVLLLVHPLSGVLKEQKNLHGHIPGCQMYKETFRSGVVGNPDPQVGYPEPNELDYPEQHEIGYPEPHEIGYPEPHDFGFPEPHDIGFPEPHEDHYPELDEIGFPEPDEDSYLEHSEIGYPEPYEDRYIALNGVSYPESNAISFTSQEVIGFPEPDEVVQPGSEEIGYPEPNIDYPASDVGFPEPDVGYTGSKEDEGSPRLRGGSGRAGKYHRARKKRRKCHRPPVFGAIHSKTWIWVGVALLVWAADWLVRVWRRRVEVEVVEVVHHPCDVVELTLRQRSFTCLPGQFVMLQCPQVSNFEWHPFTVTKTPSDDSPGTFTVFMRARGDWSKRVAALLPSKSSQVDDPSQRPTYGPQELSSRRVHAKPNLVQANYLSSKGDGERLFSPQSVQPCLSARAVDESKVYSFLQGKNSSFNLLREHCTSQPPVCTHTQDNERSCSQSPLMKHFSSSQSCIKVHSQFDHPSPVLPPGKLSQSHVGNRIDNNELESIFLNSSIKTPMHLDKHVRKIQNENEDSHQTTEHHTVHIAPDTCARLYVDGPFSSPSEDMIRYPVVVGIAGGVGITPLAATLTHILHHPASWPKRVHMIWVMRDARLILTMAHLLSSLLHQCWQDCTEDRLEFCLHVTTPISHEELQKLFGNHHPTLIPRIKQGRPQWKNLFHQYSQDYKKTKVGVFACGPKKLCQEVKRRCLRSVTQGAPFAYHQESFS
ncbi:NADPH oxidase 4-like [Penaeus indicus]|uniref:NADPH oxidase 4-like n=1 Tax=Penaeus indicus TaxID=29960 RepID=UPI00300C8DD2